MEITTKNFKEKVLDSDKPVAVEVYTDTCPNCKRFHPIFEQTAQNNSEQYHFYKLNAQFNLDIARTYKILGVPSVLYFSHGILVNKKTGIQTEKKILKRLEPLLHYNPEKAQQKELTGYFKFPWK